MLKFQYHGLHLLFYFQIHVAIKPSIFASLQVPTTLHSLIGFYAKLLILKTNKNHGLQPEIQSDKNVTRRAIRGCEVSSAGCTGEITTRKPNLE